MAGLVPIPAGPPPPGRISNFHDPPSLSALMVVLFTVLIGLTAIVLVLRLVTTYHTKQISGVGVGWAEYTSIIATVLSIVQSCIVLSLSKYMRHQWNVPLSWMTPSLFQRTYAQSVLAGPAIFSAKLSILLLYLRIFQIKRSMRVAIYCGIVAAALIYLPNIFVISYFCTAHVGEDWSLVVGLRCGDPRMLWCYVGMAILSLLLDMYIVLLPVPVVVGLKLSEKGKVGVLLMFFTAGFAVIAATLHLIYRIEMLRTRDQMWRGAQLFICNAVENYVAIIVGCMPGCATYIKICKRKSPFRTSVTSWAGPARWEAMHSAYTSEPDHILPRVGSMRSRGSLPILLSCRE
ncbi:hypothetical protein M501DRAFT_1021467 [Patellaria atrata CBS 101060]|uniref:Rhodopsin domain-containing protein n=1 Tax=Patellaria atrata CBS 101060 TaxID=1346257 RepID=A0A9P4VV01_9PEZI|nr:hypothetical protein M501DRAFT_1021467 [Patellaria atrata CBS 101060]